MVPVDIIAWPSLAHLRVGSLPQHRRARIAGSGQIPRTADSRLPPILRVLGGDFPREPRAGTVRRARSPERASAACPEMLRLSAAASGSGTGSKAKVSLSRLPSFHWAGNSWRKPAAHGGSRQFVAKAGPVGLGADGPNPETGVRVDAQEPRRVGHHRDIRHLQSRVDGSPCSLTGVARPPSARHPNTIGKSRITTSISGVVKAIRAGY